MTVYAITDTKKGRTGIAPTYLQVGAGAAAAAGAAFNNTATNIMYDVYSDSISSPHGSVGKCLL